METTSKVHLSVRQADYTMEASVEVIGQDLFIAVTGGDSPHIGTVTTLTRTTETETIRFPSHHGRFHKDDILAKRIAMYIQGDLPGSCVITSGVHVDHISKMQIAVSSQMAADLGQQILDWLKHTEFNTADSIYYSKDEKPE